MSVDESLLWYHGNLSREEAIDILQNYPNASNGLFLVRKSPTSEVDYVLSVLQDDEVIHYQIFHHGEDAFFSVEEQTIIHGLETLVEYYQTEGGKGSVCQLKTFVSKDPPPHDTRRHGRTNLLHRATKEGNANIVTELLMCGYRNIDAKNEFGQTAVHLSSRLGQDEILIKLLNAGASVNCRDADGYTPLHYACQSNFPSTVRILVEIGGANVQLRNPETGWVPLHEAASRGHIDVVLMLLRLGAPVRPRTIENSTPSTLARANGHLECDDLLSQHKCAEPRYPKSSWFHGTLDRFEAQFSFEKNGSKDGSYLVRISPQSKSYVLSVCFNKQYYYFQIQQEENLWFIDDGPFLDSLELLIEHFSRFSDGLPCLLINPVPPDPKPMVPRFPSGLNGGFFATLPLKSRHEKATDGFKNISSHLSTLPVSRKKKLVSNDPMSASLELLSNDSPELLSRTSKNLLESSFEKEYIIPFENLILKETLGEGEFGFVYRGIYQNKNGFEEEVAVKTLHDHCLSSNKNDFLQEAKVMMNLKHHCIIKLIGICTEKSLLMVQELVPLGSMLTYIIKNANSIHNHDLHLWASQIACGMHYLERQRFVHRDLAARNILLSSKNQIKICDFGLSRAIQGTQGHYTASHGGRWPIKWYAPESYNNGTFSSASDVWSFGVTLWEMFSYGQQPYGDMKGEEVINFVEKGDRLPKPSQCPRHVYRIMEQCWSYNARDRPKFATLVSLFVPDYSNMQDLVLDTDIS